MMLILVRGLPGSGKSTWVKNQLTNLDFHFEADMWFEKPEGYRFNASKIQEAHTWCLEQTRQALQYKYSQGKVYVSNTFTTLKELEPYIELVQELKCEVEVKVLKGNFRNVHNVGQEILDAMQKRWNDFSGVMLVK